MKSLLQSSEWANFKVITGWEKYNIDDINILSRHIFLGKSFVYIPEMDWIADQVRNDNLLNNIKKITKNNNTIFIRLEIIDEYRDDIIEKLKANGFIKSFEEVQPEYRQVIDISKSEDEILAQMKEKGRYNIRVAQKHGVVVEAIDCHAPLAMTKFYKLFQQTAQRDGFEIRPQRYFEKLMNILEPKGMAELLVASYNGKIVAGEIVTYYDSVASYLYGASATADRNVMAPYLLHWEAMKRAKERGCRYYDLLAVDPVEENPKSETRNPKHKEHKYAGIGRFKRQFGGRTVHIVGSWDLILQPFWYKIFKVAEQFRRK